MRTQALPMAPHRLWGATGKVSFPGTPGGLKPPSLSWRSPQLPPRGPSSPGRWRGGQQSGHDSDYARWGLLLPCLEGLSRAQPPVHLGWHQPLFPPPHRLLPAAQGRRPLPGDGAALLLQHHVPELREVLLRRLPGKPE